MKFYLLCEHCGRYNDASSEYLIFCSGCHKKLQGNFRDWQRQNPDGGLRDYHLALCLPESEVYLSDDAVKSKAGSLKRTGYLKVLIIALLCLLSFFCIIRGTALFDHFTFWSSTPGDKWTRKTYGNYGLSIEAPHLLEDVSSRLPDAGNGVIEHIQVFGSPTDEALNIVVISTEFGPGVGPVDIQGSISGFVSQMRSMPGISDFKIRQEETDVSGIPGFEQSGSFLKEGKAMAFQSLGLTRGRILWQVMIIFPDHDDSFREKSLRVMKSVEILYNTAV